MIKAVLSALASTDMTSCISTVGFPIVMCLALFAYIQKDGVTNRKRIDNLSDALNNNTLVITKLLERLDKET